MKNVSNLAELIKKNAHFYFLGIGGVSMSSLALTAKKLGCKVSGYDATLTETTARLTNAGIPVYTDFNEAYYEDVDAVVFTGAIREEDPVLAYPREKGLPIFKRPVFLGEMMKRCPNPIGVSGTHGKSTTTGMLASIFLSDPRRDPTVMVGAELPQLNGTWKWGEGEDFVFEACEYQNSFLDFFPHIALVLNVEHDHADFFPTLQDMVKSFTKFCDIAKDGFAVINADSPAALTVAQETKAPVRLFSTREKKDMWCENVKERSGFYSFDICSPQGLYCSVTLSVPGFHNVSNALGAALAAFLSGVSGEVVKIGLERFCGVKRRFEYRGKCGNMQVFDDYAHHPDEIRATLSSARAMGYEKIRVVFQSHTFSRTKAYWDAFIDALSLADEVIHMDIYPAREDPIPGITAEEMAKQSRNGLYLGSPDEIAEFLLASREDGLLIVMGAGNVIHLTEKILTHEI